MYIHVHVQNESTEGHNPWCYMTYMYIVIITLITINLLCTISHVSTYIVHVCLKIKHLSVWRSACIQKFVAQRQVHVATKPHVAYRLEVSQVVPNSSLSNSVNGKASIDLLE